MPGIFKHSHFKADLSGHGGNKRTAQLNELLLKAEITFKEADFSLYSPPPKNIISYFKGIAYTKNIGLNLKTNYAIGRYLKQFESFVKSSRPDFIIWESTIGYNLLLAEILHKNKVPFIAIPHNIESLIKGSQSVFTQKKNPDWLTEELEYLKYARHIFAISREEQWLLSVYGLNATYLPYYPIDSLKLHLLSLRDKKNKARMKPKSQKEILLLGTFYNSPTYNGYNEIINQLKGFKFIKIHVAGFGSEQLRNSYNQDNIQIWGTIDTGQLDKLIIDCDYALIHQEPTSGALTRIPEFLIAGLPVLANISASRSYYELDGIKTYNNINELCDMIQSDSIAIPAILDRPVEEKYFIDFIRSFIGEITITQK